MRRHRRLSWRRVEGLWSRGLACVRRFDYYGQRIPDLDRYADYIAALHGAGEHFHESNFVILSSVYGLVSLILSSDKTPERNALLPAMSLSFKQSRFSRWSSPNIG